MNGMEEEMGNNSYLSARLKEARKLAHMSAPEAGVAVGRSDKTIYAWENGQSEPSAEQLVVLCTTYGVDISFFYPPEVMGDDNLTNAERTIIERYRKLSEDDKAVLCGILMVLGKR